MLSSFLIYTWPTRNRVHLWHEPIISLGMKIFSKRTLILTTPTSPVNGFAVNRSSQSPKPNSKALCAVWSYEREYHLSLDPILTNLLKSELALSGSYNHCLRIAVWQVWHLKNVSNAPWQTVQIWSWSIHCRNRRSSLKDVLSSLSWHTTPVFLRYCRNGTVTRNFTDARLPIIPVEWFMWYCYCHWCASMWWGLCTNISTNMTSAVLGLHLSASSRLSMRSRCF